MPLDAWILRRLLADLSLNGEISHMSGVPRLMADHLAVTLLQERQAAMDGMLAVQSDRNEVIMALAAVDPLGPAPQIQPVSFATVADIRKIMASVRWLWEGWIPASRVVGLASLEGIGKTRLAMDLCSRVYLGQPWPDRQKMTLPPKTPSVWLCPMASTTRSRTCFRSSVYLTRP